MRTLANLQADRLRSGLVITITHSNAKRFADEVAEGNAHG